MTQGDLTSALTAGLGTKEAATAVADTTKTHTFYDMLSSASDMSFQQLLEQSISGLIHLSIKIAIACIIFFVGKWILKKLYNLLYTILLKRNVEPSLRSFLLSLTRITLTLILIVIIIGVLGINTTSFVALFASAGIAIGMALSGTLQNFAGGVMILLFKPYRVGDYIVAQGYEGTVKEIQIFNTILNTPDNKTIIIPNGGLSTGSINNFSKEATRRLEWKYGIAYGDSFDTAKAVLTKMLQEDARILKTPAFSINLSSLDDSAVTLVVRAWVKSGDYWNVFFDMNEKVYKEFGQHGLNFPFPQMDVHLDHTNN